MHTKTTVSTDKAPAAIGPYSQAVCAGPFLFCSGQIPFDPATGEMVQGDIKVQTRQVLINMAAVLAAGGSTFGDVVKTTVFLKDMGDFAAMNEVYAEFFTENFPARAAVEAARLPKDVQVEIECIALAGGGKAGCHND